MRADDKRMNYFCSELCTTFTIVVIINSKLRVEKLHFFIMLRYTPGFGPARNTEVKKVENRW